MIADDIDISEMSSKTVHTGDVINLHRLPRSQHLVSRVVLRQFTDEANLLSVLDRTTGRTRLTGIQSVFVDDEFVTGHRVQEIEDNFGRIETALGRVLPGLRDASGSPTPAVLDVLVRTVALHWARSAGIRQVHDAVMDAVVRDSRHKMAGQPRVLERAFTDETGLIPATATALAIINERAHQRVASKVAQEVWPDRIHLHLQMAFAHFQQAAVSITRNPTGDLIIGDAPVITLAEDRPGLGPHQGVGLLQCKIAIMPVAPDLAVVLDLRDEPGAAGQVSTALLNGYQEAAAIRWVARHPGSIDPFLPNARSKASSPHAI